MHRSGLFAYGAAVILPVIAAYTVRANWVFRDKMRSEFSNIGGGTPRALVRDGPAWGSGESGSSPQEGREYDND
jgi:hypothetical protein